MKLKQSSLPLPVIFHMFQPASHHGKSTTLRGHHFEEQWNAEGIVKILDYCVTSVHVLYNFYKAILTGFLLTNSSSVRCCEHYSMLQFPSSLLSLPSFTSNFLVLFVTQL